MFRKKSDRPLVYQLACRPDALVDLTAEILLLGDKIAVRIGSVEHREVEGGELPDDIASFLLSVEIPKELEQKLWETIGPYRTRP